MKIRFIKSLSLLNIVSLIALLVLPMVYFTQKAQAGNLVQTMVRFDRLAAATATGGTVCVKPTTITTVAKVVVTFPSDFVLNTTAANWTADTTSNASWPTGAVAWPATFTSPASAVDNVGKTVTFSPVGNLPSNTTLYCFNFTGTSTLTTGAAGPNKAGSVQTQTSGGSPLDTGNYAAQIVANDQVQINGTVLPTFSFTLSATTANFPATGIANTTTQTTANPTVTIATNARNGWITWVKDGNNGLLSSSSTGANIPTAGAVGSNHDLSTMSATGGFGLGVLATAGPTVVPEYSASSAGGTTVGTLSSSFRPVVTSSTFATNDVITLYPRAIASTTQAPATDYADLLTVVAAGQF
ncbi:MAG: hypothetical protein P4L62_02900 [Candidatus Pacebacteria bacterium]|nr:hypothetical protein [Candidatus Paceibacterota bacterium]